MTDENNDDAGNGGGDPVRDDAAEKLRANNAKLQRELAEAREAKRELEKFKAEREAEAEKAQEEADKKAGEFAKLEAKLKAEADTYKARYEAMVGENALKGALVAAKVDDAYKEAVEAIMLRKGVTITKDGEAQIEGQPMAEYVKAWAESEAGKPFILNGNSGGGAQGGGGGGSSGEVNPFKADTVNRTAQAELLRSDPEKAKRLQREAGLVTG